MSQQRSVHVEPGPPYSLGMADLARRFCALVESSGEHQPHWLREITELLPRLHASISSLVGTGSSNGVDDWAPDLDARFELFSHLRSLLGDRDGYWLEFDCADDCSAMTGSLADDLTDIYCELKHGLRLLDHQPDRAIRGWVVGYEFHWRRHLVDAQRHLAMLAAEGRLG
jgi:hypothetical protein